MKLFTNLFRNKKKELPFQIHPDVKELLIPENHPNPPINTLDGYSVEKRHAGWCVKNPKGCYLYYGSDDGEAYHYFFGADPGRYHVRTPECSDCKTVFTITKNGAVNALREWMHQELEDDASLPPMEIYKFK